MSKPTLIFLHGWGTTSGSLYPLIQPFKSDYQVFSPNLPYPTNKVLTLDDYCQFVIDFIDKNKIKNPILIGHSLGGAITTKIATDHPTLPSKIILLAAAAIRHELPQPWRTLQRLSPVLKPFRNLALKIARLDASDYVSLKTNIEKQTFRNLISADLSPIISKITCPTLILWGDNDTSTFVTDGQKIHSLIKNSIFKSYPNTGHFFYLDYPQEVVADIKKFLK